MVALVTGSTGTVGSKVTQALAGAGVSVRALTRSPETARLPDGVEPFAGELGDPDAMRGALRGTTGLFLLAPVTPEELNQTLITLTLAREAKVGAILYISVIHADRFTDPPHFAAKRAAERMIEDLGMPVTILRPSYYMQNDAGAREALLEQGVYPAPIGDTGILMTDVGDLAEVAARALITRERGGPAPPETIDVVSPETLTGDGVARIWSDVLGRPIGSRDDLHAYETTLGEHAPAWLALDMRLMMGRYQRDGVTAAPGTQPRLRELLERPMRSYADFARDTAASWRA